MRCVEAVVRFYGLCRSTAPLIILDLTAKDVTATTLNPPLERSRLRVSHKDVMGYGFQLLTEPVPSRSSDAHQLLEPVRCNSKR